MKPFFGKMHRRFVNLVEPYIQAMGQLKLRSADVVPGPYSVFPQKRELTNSGKTGIKFPELKRTTAVVRMGMDRNEKSVKSLRELA